MKKFSEILLYKEYENRSKDIDSKKSLSDQTKNKVPNTDRSDLKQLK